MPSVEDNLLTWGRDYDWPEGGHEWSSIWGGTDILWGGMLNPRIRCFVPTDSILEIAPGFGRITSYLIPRCNAYTGIDLAERCVLKCRNTFSEIMHASFHTTDGYSLPGVKDRSIDFAFSFDSLVHSESDVLEAYAHELARVLRPDGFAFLHHSNVGEYRDPVSGELTISNDHWRGSSMSARLMRDYATKAGIRCVAQEIINWGSPHLTDCFSLLMARPPSTSTETQIVKNPNFMDRAVDLGRAARLFARPSE